MKVASNTRPLLVIEKKIQAKNKYEKRKGNLLSVAGAMPHRLLDHSSLGLRVKKIKKAEGAIPEVIPEVVG